MGERDDDGVEGLSPLGHNPLLDDDAVFSAMFGGPAASESLGAEPVEAPAPPRRRRRRATKPKPKPTHYRVVSFSLYQADIQHLENLVRTLKERGYTKANKSQVVRFALSMVDIDKMPRPI